MFPKLYFNCLSDERNALILSLNVQREQLQNRGIHWYFNVLLWNKVNQRSKKKNGAEKRVKNFLGTCRDYYGDRILLREAEKDVWLNNDYFYGAYGGHLFRCYPIPLFSGSYFFLSPQSKVGAWPLLAILHRLALPTGYSWLEERRAHVLEHRSQVVATIDGSRDRPEPHLANSGLGNFELGFRENGRFLLGWYVHGGCVWTSVAVMCLTL